MEDKIYKCDNCHWILKKLSSCPSNPDIFEETFQIAIQGHFNPAMVIEMVMVITSVAPYLFGVY